MMEQWTIHRKANADTVRKRNNPHKHDPSGSCFFLVLDTVLFLVYDILYNNIIAYRKSDMNIPKQIAYSPSDETRRHIIRVREKYPHAVSNAQDAIALALKLVANAIVFEPNESERNALQSMKQRVDGLHGDDIRALGWSLAEWRIQREQGQGRREMSGRMLELIERIAEKLGVADDVPE